MARLRWVPTLGIGCALLLSAGTLPLLAQTPPPIKFEVPAVADPIHTNGQPDIAIDPQGRHFVSGPAGTGTQRRLLLGHLVQGQHLRVVNPATPPNPLNGTNPPPGHGVTGLNFRRH